MQVPHRAVVNFLESMAQEPGLSEQDRLVAVTTLSFDIAVNELLLPLACGAEIMLAARDEVMDGALLRKLVEDSRATTMQATPATWRLLIGAGWQGSAGFKALCGGEPLRLDLAQQLLERTGQLWNMYGPTETTVWSTCWHVEHPERGIVIGRPIANTQVWVLDEQRQLCPIGVPGEIWIGGDGVTLGYLNQPELTAARFVADPFSTGPGARLYRTGDCGRWRADGQLEHLGRLDFQVKVRGYRIELGEIEACVASYPDVVSAVVTTREDRPGDVRLVAYVVARTASKISDDALKAHLKKTLPEYMIPQHVVAVPAIPLLPNGKVDRKALPAPDTAAKPSREYVAARTDLEKLVVAAMESILSLPGVGIYDSFFMLGGHSLLAAQLASRLGRTLGIHVPMRTLFEAPSPEQLAKWIAAQLKVGDAAAWSIPRRPDRDKAPLSLMQQRVWFMEQLDPGRAVYNMPSAHRLRGKLDEAAFTAAFAAMVQRQDALRTVIAVVDETPMQLILPEVAFQLLPATDLRSLPSHDREQGLLDRLQALAGTLFDLGQAPLVSCRAVPSCRGGVRLLFHDPPHHRGRLVIRYFLSGDGHPLRSISPPAPISLVRSPHLVRRFCGVATRLDAGRGIGDPGGVLEGEAGRTDRTAGNTDRPSTSCQSCPAMAIQSGCRCRRRPSIGRAHWAFVPTRPCSCRCSPPTFSCYTN